MLPLATSTGTRNIGVLVCDLDRTLTDEHLRVVPVALRRLDAARAHGVFLVLATGRVVTEIPGGAKFVRRFDAMILEGGGIVSAGQRSRVAAEGSGWMSQLTGWLSDADVPFRRGLTSVSIAADKASVLQRYPRSSELKVQRNRDRCDVTPQGVDKGSALTWLRAQPDVAARGACLAFGDADNDLALLEAADYGVAVENAVPALKEAADEVAHGFGGQAVAAFVRHRLLEGAPPAASGRPTALPRAAV